MGILCEEGRWWRSPIGSPAGAAGGPRAGFKERYDFAGFFGISAFWSGDLEIILD